MEMAVRRARPEDQIQRAVFQHLAVRAATGVFAFHPPNGGWRSRVEAAILKGLGVRAGVPDVIAIRAGRAYALELKGPGGRLTAAQNAAHAALRAAGVTVVTCFSLDDAVAQLESWGLLRGQARNRQDGGLNGAAERVTLDLATPAHRARSRRRLCLGLAQRVRSNGQGGSYASREACYWSPRRVGRSRTG